MIKKLIGFIGVWLFGNIACISALVNFIWLLVKDNSLFSWYWVLASVVATLLSLCLAVWGALDE